MSSPSKKHRDVLNQHVIDVVPSRKSIVTCKSSDNVVDAFNLLIKNKILSVPVIDEKSGQPSAFIDAIDIVTHVSDILLEGEMKEGFDKEIAQIEFGRYTCKQLAGYSRRGLYKTILDSATLKEALVLFKNSPEHRFAVVDGSGKMVSILSQSQLVRSLMPFVQHSSELSKQKVGDLKLGYKKVLSISATAPASTAFKRMQQAGVSGLAVVDPQTNRLVGSISASDLKEIGSDASLFERVLLPVAEFWAETIRKQKHHDSGRSLSVGSSGSPSSSSQDRHAPGSMRQIYYVKPDDTLATVFEKFIQTRVHRLFVVDDQMMPIGVIALRDLVDQIAHFVEENDK